jgi:SRSO17 transposase
MSGASIETTLELWASSLWDVKRRMRPLFTQARVALSAENFLEGLLGEERRKTGWMRAEAAGDPGPWRQQAILGRGQWDADALRDIVRDYALETLADDDAVFVIDETGFLKQGKASCGVARQYTDSAGKITNCQIGVFACYVAPRGHAFIDRDCQESCVLGHSGTAGGGLWRSRKTHSTSSFLGAIRRRCFPRTDFSMS